METNVEFDNYPGRSDLYSQQSPSVRKLKLIQMTQNEIYRILSADSQQILYRDNHR